MHITQPPDFVLVFLEVWRYGCPNFIRGYDHCVPLAHLTQGTETEFITDEII